MAAYLHVHVTLHAHVDQVLYNSFHISNGVSSYVAATLGHTRYSARSEAYAIQTAVA